MWTFSEQQSLFPTERMAVIGACFAQLSSNISSAIRRWYETNTRAGDGRTFYSGSSGLLAARLVIGASAIGTNLQLWWGGGVFGLMRSAPIPMAIDPFTSVRVVPLRWAEWTVCRSGWRAIHLRMHRFQLLAGG